MARIFPFRALRYDPAKVDLARVVTQPYDKITPDMQRRYYDASPYNLVCTILPLAEPGDNVTHNVYTRAAEHFRTLRQQVLQRDPRPAIYRYDQRFVMPQQKSVAERHGFIALGQLEDYSAGSVYRHEQTLAKPKSDRLNLLRATRAHFGQIFMLYYDPARQIEALMPCERVPDLEIRDDYGVFNRLWRVDDPATIAAVQAAIADKKLIIADGHHRYETALNYRNEMRAQGKGDCEAPHERVMITLVNMAAPGLIVLPTHRVVHGVSVSGPDMLKAAAAHFFTQRLPGGTVNEILAELENSGKRAPSFIAVTADGLFLLRANLDTLGAALAHVPERQRQLDVTVLHELILRRALGLSQAAIDEQKNLAYVRDAWDAIARVRPAAGDERTADFAFLLNPVRIEQVRDIAFAGETLPQKSTDFYPKLLSGLTIYALD